MKKLKLLSNMTIVKKKDYISILKKTPTYNTSQTIINLEKK